MLSLLATHSIFTGTTLVPGGTANRGLNGQRMAGHSRFLADRSAR
jgi:hypothetical protein